MVINQSGTRELMTNITITLFCDLKSITGIESVSMTTNGVTLSRHLPALVAAGLDNVNISLDSLVPAKFSFITRRPIGIHGKVMRSIADVISSQINSIKLNVVVMKGFNEDELCDFVEFVRERPISVRFLEFMPFSGNAWQSPKFVPFDEQRKELTETSKQTIRTRYTYRSRDWLSANQGPVLPDSVAMTEKLCGHYLGGGAVTCSLVTKDSILATVKCSLLSYSLKNGALTHVQSLGDSEITGLAQSQKNSQQLMVTGMVMCQFGIQLTGR
eukprot:sb/3468144/